MMLGQPEIFDWPGALCPANIAVLPPRRTAGLTESVTNLTQSVPAIRPPFGLKLEFGTLIGGKVLAYRALLASLEGRANRVRVPLFDLWHRARDERIGAGLAPHSDGARFADGAQYLTADLSGVTVTGVQGQRHITADFSAYAAGDLNALMQGGLYFGLGDQPYIASGVWWEGSVADIRCSPTLRRDYDAEPLRLRPVMIAGLIDDDGGELMLKRGRYGGPALDLMERFDGPLP